jgi:hypothetical protein
LKAEGEDEVKIEAKIPFIYKGVAIPDRNIPRLKHLWIDKLRLTDGVFKKRLSFPRTRKSILKSLK